MPGNPTESPEFGKMFEHHLLPGPFKFVCDLLFGACDFPEGGQRVRREKAGQAGSHFPALWPFF